MSGPPLQNASPKSAENVTRAHDRNPQLIGTGRFLRDNISRLIEISCVKPSNPTQLLEQAAQIQRMERGKLSVMSEGPDGTHFKLQTWENGRNLSRHVSADQAPAVQLAIEGYKEFQNLTQQYAQQVIDRTRAESAAASKKKHYRLRPKSSSPKTRRSGG
jgi:hypothetical protein